MFLFRKTAVDRLYEFASNNPKLTAGIAVSMVYAAYYLLSKGVDNHTTVTRANGTVVETRPVDQNQAEIMDADIEGKLTNKAVGTRSIATIQRTRIVGDVVNSSRGPFQRHTLGQGPQPAVANNP